MDHEVILWSYSKSLRTLVLRGRPGEDYTDYVDLVFGDVLAMKTASSYTSLSVTESEDTREIDAFHPIPERHAGKFLKLRVSQGDGAHDGFVVCGVLTVRHGSGWSHPPAGGTGDPPGPSTG
ncbi:hypothetical protein ACFU6K_33235 [Kitasatospora sp. NPDC057512]|uniref:hypothetical protein n=1 Tax=Kitasatospora sp. NPDC057512 TaxID=3346154 RepID=UPI00369F0FCB